LKKTLFVIFILFVVVFLAACSGETTTPARGVWDGNTFVSEYFGLRFDLPENWAVMSDEEVAEMYWLDPDTMVPAGAEITAELFKDNDTPFVFDLHAYCEDTYSGIDLRILWVPYEEGDVTAPYLMEEIVASQRDAFGDMADFVVHDTTSRLGAQRWYTWDILWDDTDGTAIGRNFINMDGRFVRFISIGSTDMGQLDEILGMFRAY